MYTLTLTSDERREFDYVGDRYNAGQIADLLISLDTFNRLLDDVEWDGPGDITFMIPEHIAWQIKDLADDEDRLWPCFSQSLREKFNSFLDSIV